MVIAIRDIYEDDVETNGEEPKSMWSSGEARVYDRARERDLTPLERKKRTQEAKRCQSTPWS